jgi:segregation and condensation protein A
MEQHTYQVQLPAFKGPLDLLLHLIEQQELDITTIALAQVTDQYLAYLQLLQETRPDDLTAFLTVAARLLLLKSRALLPQPPKELEETEEVGEDLVRQLREYRQFRQMAQFLQDRDENTMHMFPRELPISKLVAGWQPKADLSGTTLDDLTAALTALLEEQEDQDAGFAVPLQTVTINSRIARIRASLRTQQKLTFESLLDDKSSIVEIIVTLLALLEMIRDGQVSVRQETLFGDILILAEQQDPQLETPN